MRRRLPPDRDRWQGQRRAPDWASAPTPRWPLLMDFCRYVWADLPSPWSMGGACAYGLRTNGVRMVWLKSRIEIAGVDWPQQVPCPHCQGWIVWAEAGYVPGYRKCQSCQRHWQIRTHGNVYDGSPWIMRPNGRRY